jgi:hypothetical protein
MAGRPGLMDPAAGGEGQMDFRHRRGGSDGFPPPEGRVRWIRLFVGYR